MWGWASTIGCVFRHAILCIWSWIPPSGVVTIPVCCRYYLQQQAICYYSCFPLLFVHYVSRHCSYYYSTTDCYVFWGFIHHYNCYNCSHFGGWPAAALGLQDVDLPPLLLQRVTRDVVGLATVLQQLPQSQVPFQAYANYAMGPLQVSFFFRV